jgi:MFS family permease
MFAMFAKFFISITFNGVYVVTSECYPTVIRGSALAICNLFARIANVISPSIMLLGTLYSRNIPYIIYGSLAMTSAVLYLIFLPETKGLILPDTIEEMINDNDNKSHDDSMKEKKNEGFKPTDF